MQSPMHVQPHVGDLPCFVSGLPLAGVNAMKTVHRPTYLSLLSSREETNDWRPQTLRAQRPRPEHLGDLARVHSPK